MNLEPYLPDWITPEKYSAFLKAYLDNKGLVVAARKPGSETIERLIPNLVGQKLVAIMGHGFMSLTFDRARLELHAPGRFIRAEEHILGTEDYWDDEFYPYDIDGEDAALIAEREPMVLGGVVAGIELTSLLEPVITFDNGIVLQTFTNSYHERWPFYLEVEGEAVSFGEGSLD
jgi:hypothetical protein